MVYEEMKRVLSKGSEGRSSRTLTSLEITLVGAASKLFATLSTYPCSVRPTMFTKFRTNLEFRLLIRSSLSRGKLIALNSWSNSLHVCSWQQEFNHIASSNTSDSFLRSYGQGFSSASRLTDQCGTSMAGQPCV